MKLQTLSDNEIIMTLIALACLLTGALILGRLFEKLQAPRVVGEILGGMLFGGTFLAALFPDLMNSVFMAYEGEGKVLNIFYQLGLSFLMFSSGYNTELEFGKKNSRIFGTLFIGSTVIPMLAALLFVNMFIGNFIGSAGSTTAFTLVFIIGVAITSIPVISKIFFDMGIINTRFANVVLTASTLQDLCLWILLNTAIDIVQSENFDIVSILVVVILTLGLFAVASLIGYQTKRIHKDIGDKNSFANNDSNSNDKSENTENNNASFLQICFIVLFVAIAVLSCLRINIMYSAFLTGYVIRCVVNKDVDAENKIKCIKEFSFSFFVPVYFALVGIQLNLLNDFSVVRFVLFFVIAFVLEWIGTVLLLKLFTKLRNDVIFNFGVTMNARGGPGIVLATVAYNYDIINVEFFTVLILTTMLSSMLAGYYLRYQQKKDETVFNFLEQTEREVLGK